MRAGLGRAGAARPHARALPRSAACRQNQRTPIVYSINLLSCLHDEHPAKRTRTCLECSYLQVLARVDCKALHAHWVTLLPVATPLAGRAQSAMLMDAAARDTSHRARTATHCVFHFVAWAHLAWVLQSACLLLLQAVQP